MNDLKDWVASKLAKQIQEEIDKDLIAQIMQTMKPIRFVWKELPNKPLVLYANLEYTHGTITPTGLREEDLIPVQEWCEKSKCGVRISFDMFRFTSEKEITAFLLVWG